MGNATSTDVSGALPTAVGTSPQAGSTTKLYKWVGAGRGGSWELAAANAGVRFYDGNEDSDGRKAEWHLEVEGAQDALDEQLDDSFEFEPKENRCSFVTEEAVWALQFPTAATFETFCQRYNKALFENQYGLESTAENNLKIFGADFMPRIGVETEDSRGAWIEDMDIDERPDPRESRPTPRKDRVAAEHESAILGMVMGAGDRSYVVREGEINVMKNVYGGVVDAGVTFSVSMGPGPSRLSLPGGGAAATPPPRGGGTPVGNLLTPNKALLMDQESKMNMLTPGSTSLFHADIETGRVVNEFSFAKDGVAVPMRDIAADSKAAQLGSANTFLSLDANRLARWDMRDPHGVVQDMSSPAALAYVGGKDYARGTKFSCMATSGDGYVVVGGEDGKVRLYNEKTLTQAKTAIPGLGAAVAAVDVTYDGKWVLATTKSYLMVVKTTYKDKESGRELCGFTSRMGATAPAPRLLRLKPADVALTGGAPLEKGHFTWITERGRQERWIVASCGNYTVLWNFRSVKVAQPEVVSLGGLTTVTNYHLIPKAEHVVDSVFMHDKYTRAAAGEEAAMIVVTDRKVYTAADDSEDEDEAEKPTLRRGLW